MGDSMALFSQSTQRIEVIVRKEDTGAATAGANEENPEKAGQVSEGGADASGTPSTYSSSSKINFRITATKTLAAGIAIGRLMLNYYVAGTSYRNGDDAMQEATQRNIEMIEEGASILASAGMGALYGARGGPWGAAIGAALGLATTATSIGLKYANKRREYNLKIFKEENAVEYTRARANLSLTTGRLR